LLLIQGRFAEGWKLHEYRYHWAAKSQPALACFQLEFPQWQGQSLQGKSIVIFPEQGRGDQIQFCRYGTELKRLGAKRVTLICQAPLITLLKSLADVDSVLNINEISKLKNHDYWTLLFSMPLHCGTDLTNIPAALPYLYADKQRLTKWSKQMPKSGLRVGLVWKGNPDHKNDANRSLPSLLSLARLWQITDLVFISLQKGPAEEKALSKPPRQKIITLSEQIEDFADTAAIIAQLDLLICVDTAVAHLAGALQKPCWVLLPSFNTDWRWLLDRNDSPWYPGVMRLFRQESNEGWDVVINRVALALAEWCQEVSAVSASGNQPVESGKSWVGRLKAMVGKLGA
jgi:hypothetical protein